MPRKAKFHLRSKLYTGELGKPMPRQHYERHARLRYAVALTQQKGKDAEAGRAHAREQVFREMAASKSEHLFEWFGIEGNDPDRWRKLALSLAARHVPGCGPSTAGRPRTRTKAADDDLAAALDAMPGNLSEKAKALVKSDPAYSGVSSETIRRRATAHKARSKGH